jgi:hypothetical protein
MRCSGVERVFAAEPDFHPASTSGEFSVVMSDDDPEHRYLRDMPVRVATELEIDPTVET